LFSVFSFLFVFGDENQFVVLTHKKHLYYTTKINREIKTEKDETTSRGPLFVELRREEKLEENEIRIKKSQKTTKQIR